MLDLSFANTPLVFLWLKDSLNDYERKFKFYYAWRFLLIDHIVKPYNNNQLNILWLWQYVINYNDFIFSGTEIALIKIER
jgi:hypothetical protein